MPDNLNLDIEKINVQASYVVSYGDNKEALVFHTDAGIRYVVSFQREQSLFKDYIVYYILLGLGGKPDVRDDKIKTTVVAIVGNFFENNDRTILYYCDLKDSRQQTRSRLFRMWFASANSDNRFIQAHGVIQADNIHHYGAIICLETNPRKNEIIAAFDEVVKQLQK